MTDMFFPFEAYQLYTRRSIFKIIGISENTKGGNWATGYCRHYDDWFIFCNINTAGRTGHDYANQWIGDDLLWFGKLNSHLRQDSIKSMIGPVGNVYIFAREDSDAPFFFLGCGIPKTIIDSKPVVIVWDFFDPLTQIPPINTPILNTAIQELGTAYSIENPLVKIIQRMEIKLNLTGEFFSQDVQDSRDKIIAAVVRRRGQPEFRKILLTAYENRCAISQTDAPEALEAAHITPYRGQHTNHPSNGLLLRADIHTLFDLGHVAIDSSNLTVLTSQTLKNTEYEELSNKKLYIPNNSSFHPSIQALDSHRQWAGF